VGNYLSNSFYQQFEQHSAWRREFALRLKLLVEWMKDHELVNAAVEERLKHLESRMRSDKLTVAFVAEYSRGKSELINALFFADFGRRVMPASAGRTTMCPTEIGYEPGLSPSVRFLPIDTRLQTQSLLDWRSQPEQWTHAELDLNRPEQLAAKLEKISETSRVTVNHARALGLWHDEQPKDNPAVGKDGMVEVPKWRHAVINIAHPLLRQGLVILDTPGLNAIGAEPELTVNLIPQADAVVFLLAADTGVTKSDLAIWDEHLRCDDPLADSRLVVLNKIDTLWDGLSSPAQLQAQIDRQRDGAAETLGVPGSRVLAVSAQKGLVARFNQDEKLLRASCIVDLEQALARDIIGRRQVILRNAVVSAVEELRLEASRMIHIRRRDFSEQVMELRGLGGKNASVIRQMLARIEHERAEFESGGAKIHAVKSVHLRLLRDTFQLLGGKALADEIATLTAVLSQSGLKFGLKKAYGQTFERLGASLHSAQLACTEIQTMLTASFRQLNAEFGFSLQAPPELSLTSYQQDLVQVELSHNQYVSLSSTFRLANQDTANRLVRALKSRLRTVLESAQVDLEMWSKSATSQLDAQLLERRRNFSRRIEAVERIQQAAGGLDERIAEIEAGQEALLQQESRLQALTDDLLNAGKWRILPPASPTWPDTGEAAALKAA
jgi:GTPase SAR1 family protein